MVGTIVILVSRSSTAPFVHTMPPACSQKLDAACKWQKASDTRVNPGCGAKDPHVLPNVHFLPTQHPLYADGTVASLSPLVPTRTLTPTLTPAFTFHLSGTFNPNPSSRSNAPVFTLTPIPFLHRAPRATL